MNSFLLYLLEASLVLVVLYGAYRFLLRKETFFGFNRFFLISILVLALTLPLLSFEFGHVDNGYIDQQVTELGNVRNAYHNSFESWAEPSTVSSENQARWWQEPLDLSRVLLLLATIVYIAGLLYRLFKLGLGYARIFGLQRKLAAADLGGFKVTELPGRMAPFSLLNTVFMP